MPQTRHQKIDIRKEKMAALQSFLVLFNIRFLATFKKNKTFNIIAFLYSLFWKILFYPLTARTPEKVISGFLTKKTCITFCAFSFRGSRVLNRFHNFLPNFIYKLMTFMILSLIKGCQNSYFFVNVPQIIQCFDFVCILLLLYVKHLIYSTRVLPLNCNIDFINVSNLLYWLVPLRESCIGWLR